MLAIVLAAPRARAETLHEALTATYQTNPRIDAERARLRASDEEVARARSGWRPTVQGQADYGMRQSVTKPTSSSSGESQPWSYGVTLSQPIFNGFRTANAVAEAEAQVRAARENLRLVEAQTLLEAATAYADVVRDAALVRLNVHNVEVLTKELTAAEARRGVREITRTDVAQARARRARAVSALDEARANLKASRATFIRVIGHKPGRLVQPGAGHKLAPRTIEEALRIADRQSPSVIAALYREQASRHSVDRIRGEMLPEVRLEAGYSRSFETSSGLDDDQTASIVGRLRVPIYQGGEVSARVRQAKHTHVSRLQEVEQARAEVQANATAAWSRLQAARARLRSDAAQVEANRVALEGVRAEERVGQRTLLDVLNAEQELLDAETARVRTRRDATVAVYTLLAAVGRLDATGLELGSDVYDPDVHYHRARGRWYGTSIAARADRRPILIDDDSDGDGLQLVETDPFDGSFEETGSLGRVPPRGGEVAPSGANGQPWGGPIVLPGHVPGGASSGLATPAAGSPAWFPTSGAGTAPSRHPPTSATATRTRKPAARPTVARRHRSAPAGEMRPRAEATVALRPAALPRPVVTGSLPVVMLRGSAAGAAPARPVVRGSFSD
ncbi:MAG: TolC family outer membrane protein [Hyphomicrobiaceae bacterium]